MNIICIASSGNCHFLRLCIREQREHAYITLMARLPQYDYYD